MTIEQLYQWAIAQGCQDYDLQVFDRDGGCIGFGTSDINLADIEIDEEHKQIIL